MNPKFEGHASGSTCEHYFYFDKDSSVHEVRDYLSENGFDTEVIDKDTVEIECLDDYDKPMKTQLKRGEYFFTDTATVYSQDRFDQHYKKIQKRYTQHGKN